MDHVHKDNWDTPIKELYCKQEIWNRINLCVVAVKRATTVCVGNVPCFMLLCPCVV